jgi:hypothetical protein
MGYHGRIFDFTNPTNQVSYLLSLPNDEPYIYVTNDIYDTTPWTVSFV